MRHWLVSLSEDNFIQSIKIGMIGGTISKLALYNLIEPGDKLVFYISTKYVQKQLPRLSQFQGIGTATGTMQLENTKLWESIDSEIYPVRLPVSIEPAKNALSIRAVLSELEFVAKYRKWTIAFLSTPREISACDFQKIQSLLF